MDLLARSGFVDARPKFFQSASGDLLEVNDAIIDCFQTIKHLLNGRDKMVFKNSLGGQLIIENNQVFHQKECRILATLLQKDPERIVILIHDIKTPILRKLLDFCTYHLQNNSEREKKAWDTNFVEVSQNVLCELASAAYYLDNKTLVNLTSKAIAGQISGKSTQELREALGTSNDLPLPASMTNHLPARFRLQAKIDSRRQYKKLSGGSTEESTSSVAEPKVIDTRTVEELLEFIGEDTKKQKKKSNPKEAKKSKKPTKNTKTQPSENAAKASKSPEKPSVNPKEVHSSDEAESNQDDTPPSINISAFNCDQSEPTQIDQKTLDELNTATKTHDTKLSLSSNSNSSVSSAQSQSSTSSRISTSTISDESEDEYQDMRSSQEISNSRVLVPFPSAVVSEPIATRQLSPYSNVYSPPSEIPSVPCYEVPKSGPTLASQHLPHSFFHPSAQVQHVYPLNGNYLVSGTQHQQLGYNLPFTTSHMIPQPSVGFTQPPDTFLAPDLPPGILPNPISNFSYPDINDSSVLSNLSILSNLGNSHNQIPLEKNRLLSDLQNDDYFDASFEAELEEFRSSLELSICFDDSSTLVGSTGKTSSRKSVGTVSAF